MEFTNGVRVRGQALRRERPRGLQPTRGVYLSARRPPPVPWRSGWIKWPDFSLPREPDAAVRTLHQLLAIGATARIEIGCRGGVGRTGTALAVLAVASGIEPDGAVAWVRDRYYPRAVETPWQRRWIERLDIVT